MTIWWVVSLTLAILNPLSAVALTALVIELKYRLRLTLWIRAVASALAVSLILHGMEQIDLLFNLREPRAVTWIGVFLSMHLLIWAIFLRTFIRRP